MATDYFTLTNSNASLSKRFKVILSGYAPAIEKSGSIKRTLDGKLDITAGGVYDVHEYAVKVKAEVDDPLYGTLADLKTFIRLNSPNGTPSNTLTLVDHYGDSHQCVIPPGKYTPEPLGVVIEGQDAYFIMNIAFNILPS